MPYQHGESIIRIAYADDDLLLQDILPDHIDSIENCKVIIRAQNGSELLNRLNQKPNTDLILIEMKMQGMDGLGACRNIKKQFPEMKILFTSIFTNELALSCMASAGADGFIPKKSPFSDFKRAIYEVMKNGHYFKNGFSFIKKNGSNGADKVNGNRFVFTDEELCFLKLVCSCQTYHSIAVNMKTNKRHIDYLRQSLFEKFEFKSRVELALFARNGGISILMLFFSMF